MFVNKFGKVRSGWKIAGVLGVYFGALLVITFATGIYISMTIVAKEGLTLDYSELNNLIIERTEQITLPLLFIHNIILILTSIIAWKFIIKRPLSNMGFGKLKYYYKDLIIGLLFGSISMTIIFVVLVLTQNATVESWIPTLTTDTIVYFLLFILVGFAEEIFGRGYVMATLRQTRNIPVVIIVSSILFTLLHSSNNGIGIIPYFNIFLVGILLAYIYLKSGNIYMCIGYHITWNYFQGSVYGFSVSGNRTRGLIKTVFSEDNIMNGGDFGPEGGIIVTIVLIFSFLFVRYYYRNSNFNFLASEATTYDTDLG